MAVVEQKKSGLKSLQAGQVLFHEGEIATSMYIIQKGQIRLFKPKGKGFIELAVLRAGEVLGEMSFFDPNSKKRSASAAAIAPADVIEISFEALGKTITTLNPWFKTLINTLADRLRRANEKIKELENNSVGYSSDYKFFQSADVVKMLSIIFLCYRSVGENKDGKWHLSFTKLKSYAIDIFHIQEVKLEEFIQLLGDEKLIEVVANPEDESKVLITQEPEKFKTFHIVYNTQRSLKDDKKLNITAKGEKFLVKVMEQVDPGKLQDGKYEVDLSLALKFFKEYNMPIVLDDFMCAKNAKFCSDYSMGEAGKITTMLNVDLVNRMFPVIKFMNAINRVNDLKAHSHATGN